MVQVLCLAQLTCWDECGAWDKCGAWDECGAWDKGGVCEMCVFGLGRCYTCVSCESGFFV